VAESAEALCFGCLPLQVQKSKAGTGRVVGFRELGLANAYTIEASFCGASVGKYAKQHFNTGKAVHDLGCE
jgi:hypothetical protein